MKHLKLILAAFVAMLAGQANAQTWTASEVGEGSFYLYNVGAKGYLVAGNNWGTRASINAQGGILTTLTLNNDKYLISTAPSFTGKCLGLNGYVDNGGTTSEYWTFEAVEGQTNVYKLSTGSAYLYADAGATTTTVGTDPGTEYAYWKLVTRANRIADLEANASKENPIDATFLLTNPNFDRESNTGVWSGGVALGGNNENFCAEKFDTTFDVYQTVTDAPKGAYALAFQGFYRYGGHGINPAGDARKNGTEKLNTKLYANDTEAPLMSILDETTAGGGSTYDGIAYPNNMAEASTAFSKGLYSTSMDFTVDVNTIKVGVKKTVAVTNDWTIFDNARLTYYGPVVDFTIYKTNLATAVANAESLEDLVEEAQNVLNAVVTTYNKEYDSADGYIEAIAAVKDATEAVEAYNAEVVKALAIGDLPPTVKTNFNNEVATQRGTVVDVATMKEATTAIADANAEAQAFVAPYTAYKAQSASILALSSQDVYTDKNDAKATFEAAIKAADESVEQITTLTEFVAPGQAILDAAKKFIAAVDINDDACFDLTCLIINPHFTTGTTEAPTGWTIESGSVTELRAATHNFEAYRMKFNLSQTITDLPKGTYKVTLQGFARHDGTDKDKTMLYCGVVTTPIKDIKAEYSTTSYFSNGMTSLGDSNYDTAYELDGQTVYQPNGMTGAYYWFQETNPMTEQPFYTNEVKTLVPTAGNMKIGFKCETDMDWVIWDNFHLYYYGSAIDVTLDENNGTAYSENIENANVTLKKTIYEGWNTVVVPFEATKAEMGASELYEYLGQNEEGALQFAAAETIEANVPYLMKAEAASNDDKEFKGVVVKAATDLVVPGTDYSFVGVYGAATLSKGDYYLGEDAFYLSDEGSKVKAYRAYIEKNENAGSKENASKLNIVINGETTNIDAIDGKAISNDAIYNLNGVRMSGKLQKGIYIQNGKKVVVK